MKSHYEHGGIVVVKIQNTSQTVSRLLRELVVVAYRNGVCISPLFWNNKENIDALAVV
ncbi:MAG: hypothetical protein ACXQS3_01080 [Candidatus Methanofastidiosia archaeon]